MTVQAPGRPRDAAIDEAILDAAWAEFARVGYADATMTAVAEAAGVKKPALYRRWPSKAQLAVATLVHFLPPLSSIDHGSLTADLDHFLDQLAQAWRSPAARWLAPLLADIGSDGVAAAAFALQLLQPRKQELGRLLDRAIARGEIRDDAPVDIIGNLLEGPMFHRAMFGTGIIDRRLLDGIRASCIDALGGSYCQR